MEAAKIELNASGHSYELRQMASSAGLLNPTPSERTKLTTILERFPIALNDQRESEASEAALANILAGPLRPASLAPVGKRRSTSAAEVSDPSAESSNSSNSGFLQSDSGTDRPRWDSGNDRPHSYSSVSYSIRSTSYGPSESLGGASGASGFESLTSAASFASRRASAPNECPLLPVAFQPRPDLFNQLLEWLLADGAGTGLAGASVAFGMGGTGKVRNPLCPALCTLHLSVSLRPALFLVLLLSPSLTRSTPSPYRLASCTLTLAVCSSTHSPLLALCS